MSTFLTEALPVAISGGLTDVGNFKLFDSTQPNVILYVTRQPRLVRNSNGRYAFGVTQYVQQQPDRSIKIIGGSSMFTLTSAVQLDQATIDEARARLAALKGGDPGRFKFVPVTAQKGKATVLLNETEGKPNKAHNDPDVGSPGGTMSFLMELSEMGAQTWAQAVKNKTSIQSGVKMNYEYLRMLPEVSAEVIVHGSRVFSHFSTALKVSYNGFWYGGSAELEAAWDTLRRSGDVEIVYVNRQAIPADDAKLLDEMTNTFAKQAYQILFDQIFAPMQQVAPAQAGNSGGVFGGANFAMKYKKQSDFIDMHQMIKFKGMTWLSASMDVDLSELTGALDASYVTDVMPQQAFDSSIVVDADPMLSNAAVSLSYSEGHSPEAPVFGNNGGNQRYTVFSQRPNDVKITCQAKIDYSPPRWPVIPFTFSKTVGEGGNQIVIKTSAWVNRHEIYMFVRDGNRVLPPSELTPDDYLVLNISFAGPHLPEPVRDSAQLTGLSMVQFNYPVDPQGRAGSQAKFSAFGVIGGRLVRSPELPIPKTDTALFVLATRGGDIQLVTSESILGESDALAEELRRGKARPVLGDGTATGAGIISEMTRDRPRHNGSSGGKPRARYEGTTVGVEYGLHGPALWLRTAAGSRQRIGLRRSEDSRPFESASRNVKVEMDDSGDYAASIVVELDRNGC